jgi:hypothetical protein
MNDVVLAGVGHLPLVLMKQFGGFAINLLDKGSLSPISTYECGDISRCFD